MRPRLPLETREIRIGIAHVCMGRGGSEARALWAIEALKRDYDVALITAGRVRPDDLEELNQFYGTSLQAGDFHVREAPLPPLMRGRQFGAALRGALFQRFCRRVAGEFDVLLSAYNLCDFGVPAIHVIADFAWDRELVQVLDPMPREGRRLIHRDNLLRRAYLALSRSFARPSGRRLLSGEDLVLMNSRWTADLMRRRHGVENAEVLYPPVAAEVPCVPFERKEFGFVCIGRIAHEKRVERMIEILRRVRELGHGIHLHVIGPIDNSPYGRLIRKLCEDHREWVIAEGAKWGDAKARLLAGHRFGINACPHEAFGIAVAEMVKAGCIPFVPDTGGQTEIVDNPDLCYRDLDDAVQKIDAVLQDEARQHRLAEQLRQGADRFSTGRFMRELRRHVESFLSRRPEKTTRAEYRPALESWLPAR